LITCGNTHLVKAAQFFQKAMPKEKIQSLLFHRHQPVQPELQKSNFIQDSILLNTHLQGVTQHWRGAYQGDLFLFGKTVHGKTDNKQLLMLHGLSGSFASILQKGTASTKQIDSTLALSDFFPQLLIDQYTFTPKGYSLNAITENNYLTIHITPEKLSTYLSMESSFDKQLLQPFMAHLIRLFTPSQSHIMSFNSDKPNGLEISVQSM
jgi:S-adenosylmethionine decarboxylase